MTVSEIDRISFIIGMVTAFAECIASECKKAAFSPPFYPADYEVLVPEAERIAEEQGIRLWYEESMDIPEASRLHWFVMYKFPEVLQEYRELRNKGFNPAWNLDKFSNLLSYGVVWGEHADKVIPNMREKRDTINTVARILLRPGDWPVPKP
jgi:hypothetical protein